MVRPFSVRDILMVQKLQEKGISLDLERSVLQPRKPLAIALLSPIPLNSIEASTYVLRDKQHKGFVQVHQGRGPAEAYLTYLAPAFNFGDGVPVIWRQLLEGLCRDQGEQGVRRIFAKLPVKATAEAEIFRGTGFRVYTQEYVFRLPQPATNGVSAGPIQLRPWESRDAWGVHRLYCLGAPRFVQQAEYMRGEIGEAATSDWAHGKHQERYVWVKNGEIAAYLRLLCGEKGHWLHLLIHPDHAEYTDALVSLGIARLGQHASKPVYCAVRTYETHLTWALKSAGFREYQTRFLMVKQIAVRLLQQATDPIPQVEGVEIAPTASARINHSNRKEEPTPVHSRVLREV